jgi:hypothetical protein
MLGVMVDFGRVVGKVVEKQVKSDVRTRGGERVKM